MDATTGFPATIITKIRRTALARGGKGIYKRRNSRSYRVIIHLNNYRTLSEEILEQYTNGWAVRIKPSEYFNEDRTERDDLPENLILGENAFVYYKLIEDFNRYPPLDNWREVVELGTRERINRDIPQKWTGEYATFINNTRTKIISGICGATNDAEYLNIIREEFELTAMPTQAGLGNFDYDFATDLEIKNVQYQIAKMIWHVKGMREYVTKLIREKDEYPDNNHSFDSEMILAEESGNLEMYLTACITHVEQYCNTNGLLDYDGLYKIRAYNKKTNQPICPLCLKTLKPEQFTEVSTQDEGREEEDNTQSEIVLMHINSLQPGMFNHRTYNLGWGHKHCNTIQSNYSIDEIISYLKKIIKSNRKCIFW